MMKLQKFIKTHLNGSLGAPKFIHLRSKCRFDNFTSPLQVFPGFLGEVFWQNERTTTYPPNENIFVLCARILLFLWGAR